MPFTARMLQECNPFDSYYQFSVSIVSPTGIVYASENMKSSFEYRRAFTAPTLSYCSTKTCGWASLTGVIKVPQNAVDGNYQVKIRLTPRYASSASAAKTLVMAGYLSTSKQPPYIPSADVKIAAGSDGVLACYLTDVIPAQADKYSITGTDWRLSINGVLVDEASNFELASTDNGRTINLTHGPLTSRFVDVAQTRIYSYMFANLDKGSTYSCGVAFHTTNGVGPFNTVSMVSTVKTNGFGVIPDPVVKIPPVPKKKIATIVCSKGKSTKTVKGIAPKCPKGYKVTVKK
jgi:hypothetical protein